MNERANIQQNWEMGFLTYQEYVSQMAETMPELHAVKIRREVHDILWSDEIRKLEMELQEKIDNAIAQNGLIASILGNYINK